MSTFFQIVAIVKQGGNTGNMTSEGVKIITIPTPEVGKFLAEHREFFEYLSEWKHSLNSISLMELTNNGRQGKKAAIASVDLIKCFTSQGVLASPRIAAIVPNVVRLFENAYRLGVRDFLLSQDTHLSDSPQFEDFGVHCEQGTVESETVDELAHLPFANEFTIMPKDSLDPSMKTDLDKWFDDRSELSSVIVVGDCTDICIYQLAMHLNIRADAMRRKLQVIVPADCVETYDLTVQDAKKTGAKPHCAEVLHLIFLYHMALCGVTVVKHVE